MKVLWLWIGLAIGGCAAPVEGLFPPQPGAPVRTVYVEAAGWHSGIVLARADVPREIWPESDHFPQAVYLRVGWGDHDYYRTPGFHLGYGLKALFWPTASVLHVVGFSQPVDVYYPYSAIVEIQLSVEGFERLCAYIAASYARDEEGEAIILGPGRYGDSLFYLSNETYHLFKTSNVWTARGLRFAGVPLVPFLAPTRWALFLQLRNYGRMVQEPSEPETADVAGAR